MNTEQGALSDTEKVNAQKSLELLKALLHLIQKQTQQQTQPLPKSYLELKIKQLRIEKNTADVFLLAWQIQIAYILMPTRTISDVITLCESFVIQAERYKSIDQRLLEESRYILAARMLLYAFKWRYTPKNIEEIVKRPIYQEIIEKNRAIEAAQEARKTNQFISNSQNNNDPSSKRGTPGMKSSL